MCQGDERKRTIDEASLAKLASHIRTKVLFASWDNGRGTRIQHARQKVLMFMSVADYLVVVLNSL